MLDDELKRLAHRYMSRERVRHMERENRAFEQLDARKARVIELRYLRGLSVEETAEALGVGGGTVMRDWRLARVWLHRELSRSRGEVL